MNRRRSTAAVLSIVLAIAKAGCSKTVTTTTPGALNSFDGNAYQALIVIQASLNQAKTLVTPKTPSAVKTALNTAGAAYNTAENAYKAYHNALAAGSAPDAGTLTVQISQLITDITNVIVALGGTPPARPGAF